MPATNVVPLTTHRDQRLIEQVRERLDYDLLTGQLFWKSRTIRKTHAHWDTAWNIKFAGKIAGHTTNHGYVRLLLSGHRYLAHQIAWLHVYGAWPEHHLDHINGEKADNRIANLRLATKAQNKANTEKNKNNTSGYKGVTLHADGKWAARIMHNRKGFHLGLFDRPEDAAEAYQQAASALFGQYARQP